MAVIGPVGATPRRCYQRVRIVRLRQHLPDDEAIYLCDLLAVCKTKEEGDERRREERVEMKESEGCFLIRERVSRGAMLGVESIIMRLLAKFLCFLIRCERMFFSI